MDLVELKSLSKDEISERARKLDSNEISFLVACLTEKDEKIRYPAFLLLQASSQEFPFVYKYWDVLQSKLGSDNSYHRSTGLKLIAENVRWDEDNRFARTINKYLRCCNDDKFITARQAIQALAIVISVTKTYNDPIKRSLTNFSSAKYNKGQIKLLNEDIRKILKIIENEGKQPK